MMNERPTKARVVKSRRIRRAMAAFTSGARDGTREVMISQMQQAMEVARPDEVGHEFILHDSCPIGRVEISALA